MMMPLHSLVWAMACSSDQEKCFMAKEMTVEADLEMPILQCTRQTPPTPTQSRMKR